MNSIIVDPLTCIRCRLCVEVCPNRSIEALPTGEIGRSPTMGAACFACGQCMAICPTRSIGVEGLSYDRDFLELPKGKPGEADFFNLLASRRSIRNFQPRPVARELLEKVIQAISLAPPGFPPLKYSLVVVETTELIRQALPLMIELYDFLLGAMKNPVARFFIRHKVGGKKFLTMEKHLLPLLRLRLPRLKAGVEDTLTRKAPAMILFLADKEGEDVAVDVHVACAFGILAAHSLGLGASMMDIIPPAINQKSELRALYQIPAGKEVVSSMILGHPQYQFQRGIKRTIPGVRWL